MEVGKDKGQRPTTFVWHKESEMGDGEEPENGTNVGISKRDRTAGIWLLLPSECLGQWEVHVVTCRVVPAKAKGLPPLDCDKKMCFI